MRTKATGGWPACSRCAVTACASQPPAKVADQDGWGVGGGQNRVDVEGDAGLQGWPGRIRLPRSRAGRPRGHHGPRPVRGPAGPTGAWSRRAASTGSRPAGTRTRRPRRRPRQARRPVRTRRGVGRRRSTAPCPHRGGRWRTPAGTARRRRSLPRPGPRCPFGAGWRARPGWGGRMPVVARSRSRSPTVVRESKPRSARSVSAGTRSAWPSTATTSTSKPPSPRSPPPCRRSTGTRRHDAPRTAAPRQWPGPRTNDERACSTPRRAAFPRSLLT